MSKSRFLFRLQAWLAALLLPLAALAADPPERVARLNLIEGAVSFASGEQEDWSGAMLNRPLTTGDKLWVERGGRAELHVGSTALRLGGDTAIEIVYLGNEDLQLKLTQGTLALRVRDYPSDEYIEIDTPNLGFTVRSEGEYRFDVAPRGEATTLTVRQGSGAVYEEDESRPAQRVQSGQRLRFEGDDLRVAESGGVGPRDSFDHWVASRDAREDAVRSSRYVSREMTGYEDLDEHGEWETVEGYGTVWFPRVTVANWAPYHYGRWVWVAPWGWTWVDEAPWGFAPFHYGRWAWYGHRWCWVPGPVVRRPVYAPALVAFVGGGGGGVSWTVSLSSGPGVAWFPLGPGEAYRPGYSHAPRYYERINPHRGWQRNDGVYVNQRIPSAIAVIPETAFREGRPVRPGATPRQRDHDWARLPAGEAPPLRPVRGQWDAPRAVPPDYAFRQPAIGERGRRPDREPGGPGWRRGSFPPPQTNIGNPAASPFPRDEAPRGGWDRRPDRGFTPPVRTLPETTLPAPNNEGRRRPEMRTPESRMPGFNQPLPPSEMRRPEWRQPEMRMPERQPEFRHPEMRRPDFQRPDARVPEMRAPGPDQRPPPGQPGGWQRSERAR